MADQTEQELLEQAHLALIRGRYSESKTLLDQVLAINPGNGEARKLLMDVDSHQGATNQAGVYNTSTQHSQLHSNSDEAAAAEMMVQAQQAIADCDPHKARFILQGLLLLEPNNQAAQRLLASVNISVGGLMYQDAMFQSFTNSKLYKSVGVGFLGLGVVLVIISLTTGIFNGEFFLFSHLGPISAGSYPHNTYGGYHHHSMLGLLAFRLGAMSASVGFCMLYQTMLVRWRARQSMINADLGSNSWMQSQNPIDQYFNSTSRYPWWMQW